MKTILPGSAVGVLGGGENGRMFALAAQCMGYTVEIYSPDAGTPYEDLDRVREFAARADVVTVLAGDVPAITLHAAAASAPVRPGPKVFEVLENGAASKPDAAADALLEFSIVGARGADGAFVHYAPIAIDRIDGALDIARCPAPVDARTAKRAAALVRDTLEDVELVGIACVEFRLTHERELALGEITPYPHPSGYLTCDAGVTGQFGQQLRAICGLPLGDTALLRPVAMAIVNGAPDWSAALAFPGVKIHPRGTGGGYLTAGAASATRAKQVVRAARSAAMAAG